MNKKPFSAFQSNLWISHQWTNRLHRSEQSVYRTNSGSTRLRRPLINSVSWRCERAGSPEAAQMFEASWRSEPIKTSAAKLTFHLSTDCTVKKILKIHLNQTRHESSNQVPGQLPNHVRGKTILVLAADVSVRGSEVWRGRIKKQNDWIVLSQQQNIVWVWRLVSGVITPSRYANILHPPPEPAGGWWGWCRAEGGMGVSLQLK